MGATVVQGDGGHFKRRKKDGREEKYSNCVSKVKWRSTSHGKRNRPDRVRLMRTNMGKSKTVYH